MSVLDEIERASGDGWSQHGCTSPHSVECHAAFEPDCPKYADLNEHMRRSHIGWAIKCQLEPCKSSPWFDRE